MRLTWRIEEGWLLVAQAKAWTPKDFSTADRAIRQLRDRYHYHGEIVVADNPEGSST